MAVVTWNTVENQANHVSLGGKGRKQGGERKSRVSYLEIMFPDFVKFILLSQSLNF